MNRYPFHTPASLADVATRRAAAAALAPNPHAAAQLLRYRNTRCCYFATLLRKYNSFICSLFGLFAR